MKKLALALTLILVTPLAWAQQDCDWTGTWGSSYGDLRLIQEGTAISGDYANRGTITGKVDSSCQFNGEFYEARNGTTGAFRFDRRADRFSGKWGEIGSPLETNWSGFIKSPDRPELTNMAIDENVCSWTGTYSSSYGELRLVHENNEVTGDYANLGTLSGLVDEQCVVSGVFFNIREGIEGEFEMGRQGERFVGSWFETVDDQNSRPWSGYHMTTETPVLTNQDMAAIWCSWTGTWSSSLGNLMLIQDGSRVYGGNFRYGEIEAEATTECGPNGVTELNGKFTDHQREEVEFNIIKTGSRFEGTWASVGPTFYSVYTEGEKPQWGGNQYSTEKPTRAEIDLVTRPPASDPVIVPRIEPSYIPSPQNNVMAGTWEVALSAVCAVVAKNDESSDVRDSIDPVGIGWVRARVVHKQTGEEIEVAPVGGFPNIRGDKERAWEAINSRYPVPETGCNTLVNGGHTSRPEVDPVTLRYEIDASKFGYASLDELLAQRRNRLRVMFKLTDLDYGLNPDDDLGTQAKSIPLIEADFCGSCNAIMGSNTGGAQRLRLGAIPSGNGVLSGYSDADIEAVVLYDIRPLH